MRSGEMEGGEQRRRQGKCRRRERGAGKKERSRKTIEDQSQTEEVGVWIDGPRTRWRKKDQQ